MKLFVGISDMFPKDPSAALQIKTSILLLESFLILSAICFVFSISCKS